MAKSKAKRYTLDVNPTNKNSILSFIFIVLILSIVKAGNVLVLLKSIVTGHAVPYIRPRIADKVEVWRYDPFLHQETLYRESKKIRSIRANIKEKEPL